MIIRDIFQHAVQITAFVAVMMIAIEYLNILTRGAWPRTLASSRWKQYLIATFLGATPGCLGAFAVVALFTHRMVSFGALVACMVATSGDESFVMLAMFPWKAMPIFLGLAVLGLAAGVVTDRVLAKPPFRSPASHSLILHEEEPCRCFPGEKILLQLRYLSLARGSLVAGVGLFVLALLAGRVGPPEWNWMRVTLLLAGGFVLFIVLTVPDHFLEEHLWRHTALQHVPRIFGWTLGTLFVVAALEEFDLVAMVGGGTRWAILGGASILGLVPESGPHLLIVSLFREGIIPLSPLIANSIVQDGHGMLPLLAHSRVEFLKVKGINLATGLAAGGILMALGW